MEKLKVIQFLDVMNDGGAETLVKDYLLMLDKEQFDVVLVNIWQAHNTANWEIVTKNKIRIITIYPWWFLRWWNIPCMVLHKLIKKWYIPWRLKKIIKNEKPDIIHVHHFLLRYLKAIAKELTNIKLFYTCHSLPKFFLGDNQSPEYLAAAYLIKHNNLRLIGLHADMVVELNNMFNIDNTFLLNNGIDFRCFNNNATTKDIERNDLHIPQDAFVLGHVGSFKKPKNHKFLADIFIKIAANNPKAYLLMVGSGWLGNGGWRKWLIQKKLNFAGLKGRYQILSNRSDINKILKAMDVFLFPSLWEGLSIALVEAQVSGLRCVVSDAINKAGILTSKCKVLPLGDADLWANTILNNDADDKSFNNFDDWNMRKEIKKLEMFYKGEDNIKKTE
ncbi:MAG: glycosyltransferase [Phascolarctobacterium sp.]|nr:glycosyltransferase [Candidatus Phascolarctobacterium caballi]